MFTFEADDELALIVDMARRLAKDELQPKTRQAEKSRSPDERLRLVWQEVGLASLELPVAHDGPGLGCLARVLVNEELAAGDAGAALALDPFGPAATTALEVGGEDAVGALIRAVGYLGDRALFVSAHDAQISICDDVLDLRAGWVPAEKAKAVVVLSGDEAFLVTEGLQFDPVRGAGLRAAGAASLTLKAAPIAARWSNSSGAGRALARARLYYASLLLGILRASCEFATDYAQQREAFGKPIGHHQALAFLITDMHMALDAARLVVQEAAWRVDQGLPCEVEASSAWAECIEISRTIGPNGVQVLGGHGFMADYPVEKHMREARALGLMLGGYDAAVDFAGARLTESEMPLALCMPGAL